MVIHKFGAQEELGMFAWVDAASQNRCDGGSTQGLFLGVGPLSLLKGDMCKITAIGWHSNRIDGACRSPGAAETQAAVNGEDALFYARFQWGELLYGSPNIRNPEEMVARTTGCLITDSRNVYDKLHTEVLSIKGAEKRTHVELLSLKESQQSVGLVVRWVHSEAQIANALTKSGPCRELELFYQMNHQWRIIDDPFMRSARKRKTEGLNPLGSDISGIARCEFIFHFPGGGGACR